MPTSFGDFQKANKDLAKFDQKKTFKLKAKTSSGNKLATKYTLGKGLNIEGSQKTNAINYTKLAADSDGHFEVEAELNDAIADCTIGLTAKVGSEAWKGSEECNLTLNYSNSDVDFNSTTALLGVGAVGQELDVSYALGDMEIGGSCSLKLPFALVGKKGSFELSNTAFGLKQTSGDLTFGANFTDIHKLQAAGMGLSVLHKCSGDTTWGARVSSATTWKPSAVKANMAFETALDGQTKFSFGLDSAGVLQAKFAQDVSSKITMTYQTKVDTNNLAGDQSFGFGIQMNA